MPLWSSAVATACHLTGVDGRSSSSAGIIWWTGMRKTKLPQFDDFRLAMCQALGIPEDSKLESFNVRFYKTHHLVTVTTKMWNFEQRSMVNQVQKFKMVKNDK